MSHLSADDIRRLPKRARDQIASQLAAQVERKAARGGHKVTPKNEQCDYRCHTCGEEFNYDPVLRKLNYTRAEEHVDTAHHAGRIEVALTDTRTR